MMTTLSGEEVDRSFGLCSCLEGRYAGKPIVTCTTDTCRGRFFAPCCQHKDQTQPKCHHFRVVQTDGACMNNGASGAVSGIGIAFGSESNADDGYQFSIPVDDRLDPGGKRTSQRAELLAALEGLKKIADHDEGFFAESSNTRTEGKDKPMIIVTTDSEYVVRGMTEWLPTWRVNGFRKSNGQRPSNLDLFIRLDDEVSKREREHDCDVAFWYLQREHNTVADALAKSGARAAAAANRGSATCIQKFAPIAIEC